MSDILKLFLEISVMASIMIGIVLIIRRVFSRKMSPAVMLVLWGLVLIRLIMPFTFTSPVSFAELFPEQINAAGTQGEITSMDNMTASVNETDFSPSVETENRAASISAAETAAGNSSCRKDRSCGKREFAE